jgi:polyhydroxyalkanoate synthesis regulator phasin
MVFLQEGCVEKQNVTLSLPKTLVKKAKLLAVEEEKSFNELVRQCLEQRLNAATGYAEARERQLKRIESGFDLGTNGKISVTREEIHER